MPTSELIEREQALSDILQSMQDTLTQQGKFCPAIHHALDEFEFVDVSFDDTVVLGKGQPGHHCCLVLLNSQNKAPQFANLAFRDVGEPVIKLLSLAMMKHRPKFLDELIG